MESIVGLVVFTLGLGVVVAPAAVGDAVGEQFGRTAGRRATIALRGGGFAAMALGFALLVR